MDFSQLYRQYARDVFRFALYLSGDATLAEDIAAETFARALTARGTIRVGSVKAYLLAIARNLHRDALRRRRRSAILADTHLSIPDGAPGPEAAAAGHADLARTMAALQELPEGERAALLMAAQDNLPYEQIAAALSCSVAAVKVRVHRARVHLRARLDERRRNP
jgi:RNA polymerase sigma-70 factor (ECF subfamily)